jgi:hypothetical protein
VKRALFFVFKAPRDGAAIGCVPREWSLRHWDIAVGRTTGRRFGPFPRGGRSRACGARGVVPGVVQSSRTYGFLWGCRRLQKDCRGVSPGSSTRAGSRTYSHGAAEPCEAMRLAICNSRAPLFPSPLMTVRRERGCICATGRWIRLCTDPMDRTCGSGQGPTGCPGLSAPSAAVQRPMGWCCRESEMAIRVRGRAVLGSTSLRRRSDVRLFRNSSGRDAQFHVKHWRRGCHIPPVPGLISANCWENPQARRY